MILDDAVALAARAHAGQFDKAGKPYIDHPLRVMARVTTPDERVAAILHDVVEDTAVTLGDLRGGGCPEEVVAAVDSLTKRLGEDKMAYYRRVASNPIALVVKRATAYSARPYRRDALATKFALPPLVPQPVP
jgi:(p)ppGpp synthase/HD superfamily hydrolase